MIILRYILFLDKNVHCGYSLELPRRGDSKGVPTMRVFMEYWKNIPELSSTIPP